MADVAVQILIRHPAKRSNLVMWFQYTATSDTRLQSYSSPRCCRSEKLDLQLALLEITTAEQDFLNDFAFN